MTTPSNAELGRRDLLAWRESKPENYFSSDSNLHRVLATRLGADRLEAERPRLSDAGLMVGRDLARLQVITSQDENLPRLERYDGLGVRTEEVVFHPAYHEAGRHIWRTGIMSDYAAPGNETVQMALFYLIAQPGENGHNCPLACTAGLIKTVAALGTEEQRARWLPRLLERDYDARLHASQFLTEVQGGSDVGQNAVRATKDGEGRWRVHGEKWFCSVIDAQLFLMTARPEGAPEGTRGLGLFVVPRSVDGTANAFTIRRLKKKLGTRAMASAEADFEGALAEPLGELERGFKNVVEIVLTTSRIYNAVSCAGSIRSAHREAASYARHRRAFGRAISTYPLIQDALTTLSMETMAATASTFRLVAQADAIALGKASEETLASFRLGVNVNKYWTSVRNTQMARLGMEVLGGNGAIETFSPLVQLYRDAMVLESWEGAHNVLVQQVLRDAERLGVHRGFIADLTESLARVPDRDREAADRARRGVAALGRGFERAAAGETDQRFGRALVDQCAAVLQQVAMLEELAAFPGDDAKREAIALHAHRFVAEDLVPPAALGPALLARSLAPDT